MFNSSGRGLRLRHLEHQRAFLVRPAKRAKERVSIAPHAPKKGQKKFPLWKVSRTNVDLQALVQQLRRRQPTVPRCSHLLELFRARAVFEVLVRGLLLADGRAAVVRARLVRVVVTGEDSKFFGEG